MKPRSVAKASCGHCIVKVLQGSQSWLGIDIKAALISSASIISFPIPPTLCLRCSLTTSSRSDCALPGNIAPRTASGQKDGRLLAWRPPVEWHPRWDLSQRVDRRTANNWRLGGVGMDDKEEGGRRDVEEEKHGGRWREEHEDPSRQSVASTPPRRPPSRSRCPVWLTRGPRQATKATKMVQDAPRRPQRA